MSANPNGYVPIFDGGAPRIITGYAGEAVSGGWFLGGSRDSGKGVVGSGADSFVTSDIVFSHTIGSGNFIGIALKNTVSGAAVSVATRGTFLVEVSGTIGIEGGQLVGCNDDDEAIYIGSHALGYHSAINTIGRAFTAGSNDEFIVMDLHG